MVKLLLPVWLALFGSLNLASASPEDHEALAQRFLENYSLQDAKPADLPLSTLLEGRFLTARAGLIDLRVPMHELTDKDLAEQTAATLAALDRSLSDAGSSRERILSATVYLTDISRKQEMDDVWCDWIGPAENWPQRACVQAALAPGHLVEIVLVAARDD